MAVTQIGTLVQFTTGSNAVADLNSNLSLITTQFNNLVTGSNTLISGLTIPSPTITGSLTMTTAVSKIVPGATSLSLRNNADSADNLILTDAGAATFRSTVGGITTLTATTLAGTLSTAAQPNVTSLGTLTGLTLSGVVLLPDGSASAVAVGFSSSAGTGLYKRLSSPDHRIGFSVNGVNQLVLQAGILYAETAGGVALGATTNPLGAIHVGYDASNRLDVTVSSVGLVTYAAVGVSASHTFGSQSVSMGPLTATTITGTLSTAAQPNVTSLGTLTALNVAGDAKLTTAGNGIYVKEGTNATMGTATLGAGGSVTVSNTKVTASSRLFLSRISLGGTIGWLTYSLSAGVSFTINSNSGTDTSTVAWLLVEPA